MTEPRTSPKHIYVTILLLILMSVVIVILAKGLSLDQTKIPSVQIGKPAQGFQVDWVQGREHLGAAKGKTFSMADFRGKVLLLNFWASWCTSCRVEARDLEMLWKKFGAQGVFVVGIAIQDSQEAAKAFATQYGKTYLLGLDIDGKAAIDYGVTGVPETFLIGRDGKIVFKEAGPVNPESLAKKIATLL